MCGYKPTTKPCETFCIISTVCSATQTRHLRRPVGIEPDLLANCLHTTPWMNDWVSDATAISTSHAPHAVPTGSRQFSDLPQQQQFGLLLTVRRTSSNGCRLSYPWNNNVALSIIDCTMRPAVLLNSTFSPFDGKGTTSWLSFIPAQSDILKLCCSLRGCYTQIHQVIDETLFQLLATAGL